MKVPLVLPRSITYGLYRPNKQAIVSEVYVENICHKLAPNNRAPQSHLTCFDEVPSGLSFSTCL